MWKKLKISESIKRWAIVLLSIVVVLIPFSSSEQLSDATASGITEIEGLEEDATLKEKLDLILADDVLANSMTGVHVRNATTGEEVYEQFSDIRLRPASNMKLFTAVAALETLGTDYTFTTEVLTDGAVSGSTLEGDVYVKGKGDPTLLKEDLDQFADELLNQGIEEISGDILGDDTWYDDVRLSEDMSWDNEPSYVAAQISALTMSPNDDYDTGSVIVEVTPGSEVGEPAEVKTVPETDHVTIVNNTETGDSNASNSVSVNREHGTNDIVIDGSMPLNANKSRTWSSVWDPTVYTLDIFKKSLEEKGITLKEDVATKRATAPKDAEQLTSKESMPLEDIMIPFMKLSNNGHAEMLTKEMGVVEYDEGSWSKGLEVIYDVAESLGVDKDTIMLRDGSGMSDKGLIPAEQFTSLLYAAQDRAWYPDFLNSLPVAGASDRMVGGTLRNRLTGESTKENATAKTGSTTSVSTLTGYVTTKDGEKLIFSILNNNFKSGSMPTIQDKIVTVLAEHKVEDGEGEEVSVADIKSLVETLESEGEFSDDLSARALKTHLSAIAVYEGQDNIDKVLKHMDGFYTLLDHQEEEGVISDKAYQALIILADEYVDEISNE